MLSHPVKRAVYDEFGDQGLEVLESISTAVAESNESKSSDSHTYGTKNTSAGAEGDDNVGFALLRQDSVLTSRLSLMRTPSMPVAPEWRNE